uniref:BHLH domain-containing protein n=1 Tax=Caenorhabditis tropicalis TaxID=1561998 RepID=A0A1I7TZA2_9PELO
MEPYPCNCPEDCPVHSCVTQPIKSPVKKRTTASRKKRKNQKSIKPEQAETEDDEKEEVTYPVRKKVRIAPKGLTAQQKKKWRAGHQREYLATVNEMFKTLQQKIPYIKDMTRRVSHANVLQLALLYIKHLDDILKGNPTTDFTETAMRMTNRSRRQRTRKKSPIEDEK